MKLSVLILTHNRPKLFKRAISSVLNNLPGYDIEILVNNDTSDIDEIYDDRVPIKYHYFQHDDLSCIYKYLFDRATGEFIYYLEDDDYIRVNFFECLDLTTDINYMEYISEPLIREIGPYHSFKRISKNRVINHKNNAKIFVDNIDSEEFQLGQIVFRRSLVDIFPKGNTIYNDFVLFQKIANDNTSFKYVNEVTWVQTTDGQDNISFPEYNKDVRFH
jgi:glycosyltransferase involved in cell wall biosynthesis